MPPTRRLVSLALFLAAIFAAAPSAQAEPAIWVVKGPHATVYLFGTVHALAKDDPWRSSPKVDAAIKQSQTLWLEIPNVDDAAAMQPLVMQLGMDPGTPALGQTHSRSARQASPRTQPAPASPAARLFSNP